MARLEGRTKEQIVTVVSSEIIILNIFLTVFKLFGGIAAKSTAMMSDGVHSLADVFTSILVIISVKLDVRRSGRKHRFGPEPMECAAAIILSVMLFAIGLGIGWAGVNKIIAVDRGDHSAPGLLALIAAIVSMCVKEGMYWNNRWAARKTGSPAVMADAWHQRSDALASLGSFAGILGARMGAPVLDPVACLVICVLIIKVAIDIFREAVRKLSGKAPAEKAHGRRKGYGAGEMGGPDEHIEGKSRRRDNNK